jgi:hypothetical protein
MPQPRHGRPSAGVLFSITALGTTINPDSTQPAPEVAPPHGPSGAAGQLSTFDRLIWGRGQEPVIEG